MANSVGERAREDAEAEKARSIDRNLMIESQGIGRELSIHTGKPALVREICRRRRLKQKSEYAAEHTQKDNDLTFGFSRITSIEFIGVDMRKEILYDDEEYERFAARLEALSRQIPAYVDFHEYSAFEGEPEDVPKEYLGMFRSPRKDLKIEHDAEWIRSLWQDETETS